MKNEILVITAILLISYSVSIFSQEKGCNDFKGLWMGLDDNGESVYWDINQDNSLIISYFKNGNCEVKVQDLYKSQGRKLFIADVDSTKTYELLIKELDCKKLKLMNVKNGKEYGKIIELGRVQESHPCDFNSASEISIKNLPKDPKTTKYFGRLLWFYSVYIIGAFIVALKWFFHPDFLKSFLTKWLPACLVYCVLFYSSSYGFINDGIDIQLIKGGKANPDFKLLPINITTGEFSISKDSLQFWIVTFVFYSIILFIPISAWSTWKKNIAKNNLISRIIHWTNRAVFGVGIVVIGTAQTITSLLMGGAKNWLLLIASYMALLFIIKKTFWDGFLGIKDVLNKADF